MSNDDHLRVFLVVAEHSDEDRNKGEALADDCADGACHDIVDKPRGRVDKGASSESRRIVKLVADSYRNHADDGEHLDYEIERSCLFAEHGEV